MNYEVLFYHSGKTAEIERLLERKLEDIGLERRASSAATEPDELPAQLRLSLQDCGIVFIIGGMDGGSFSTEKLLSAVLSSSSGITSDRLVDDDGNTGYILKSEGQRIVLLPDDTQTVSDMLDYHIINEFKEAYSLTPIESQKPAIGEITDRLNGQLSEMSSTRTGLFSPKPVAAVPPQPDRLSLISVILSAAAVVLGLLAILFLLL